MVYTTLMAPRPPALVLVGLAAQIAVGVAAGAVELKTAPAAVEFVMPAAGAFIPAGAVVVAGRLPEGAGFVNLLLDGAPVAEIVREGRTFFALLAPEPGPHTVEARAGDQAASLVFTFGAGGTDLAPYRFHAPVLERRCAECHAGMRQTSRNAEANTCRSCHRKLMLIFPFLHGPVAAGKCLVCHDPHGSTWPALTVADARTMCTRCHDQPGSLEHAEKTLSRVCYLCHNPHAGMNRKLLYDIVR